jgi:hypothetical protein
MRQFTEEDILMAEKAEEIQAQWGYEGGDLYKDKCYHILGVQCISEDVKDDDSGGHLLTKEQQLKWYKEDKSIWLPLEHQLWEMVQEKRGFEWGMAFYEFWNFVTKSANGLYAPDGLLLETYPSLWQLLLAFVMHKLYQKQWDSKRKEWVIGARIRNSSLSHWTDATTTP